jgi:hypothetical protein
MVMVPIPKDFRPFFRKVSSTITLKAYTGCNSNIKTKRVDGQAILDQGQGRFATWFHSRRSVWSFVEWSSSTTRVVR